LEANVTTRAKRPRASPPKPPGPIYELGPKPDYREAIELLRSWREASEEEAQEQQETFEALRKGIDEERARLGMRLLFS
jgi:hypothetical protein